MLDQSSSFEFVNEWVNLVKSRMMNLHSRDTFDCASTNREIETEFETIERILYWQIKA